MNHQAAFPAPRSCDCASCMPFLFGRGGQDQAIPAATRLVAFIECDDPLAIARIREILPASAVMEITALTPPGGGTEMTEPRLRPVLTARQTEILRHLVRGLSNKEIGRAIGISHFTVRNHVSKLLHMFGAATRRDLESLSAFAGH